MNNKFEIIATINTGSAQHEKVPGFIKNGATILRLNGSFLTNDTIKEEISRLSKVCGRSAKILVDLPGYKLRFLYIKKNIRFKKSSPVRLKKEYFNYPDFFAIVKIGTILRINNGFVTFTVIDKEKDALICDPDSDGVIVKGRGLHIDKATYRPNPNSLTDFDLRVIEAVKECPIDFVGLSFVHDIADIRFIEKKLNNQKIKCIPKVETKESVRSHNLYSILKHSEMVILDRGDLAGEIGLDNIWQAQKDIASLAKILGCRLILATQVLASMVNNPIPTIAEVDSLFGMLDSGIDGIQLSEEVSVGKYPGESISFINRCAKKFETSGKLPAKKQGKVFWLLGMTSSGKTTLSLRVKEKLISKGYSLVHYDGDEIRNMFSPSHGFSENDRLVVVKNLAYLANKAAENGFNVIVSALTAHDSARFYIKDNIHNLVTVFLKCSVEECIRRDPKGLYRKAKNGQIKTLAGYNSPYTIPDFTDLVIDVEKKSIEQSADLLIDFIIKNHLLCSADLAAQDGK